MTVVSTSRAETIRYRINATTLGSLEEYGQQFRERAAFTLTGLSDAEERIVQKAITNEDGYVIHAEDGSNTPELPSGAKQLAERFAAHENKTFERNVRFENGSRIFYLVTYNDQTYWTEVNINREGL
jgi:hypothetical protein